MTHTLSSAGHHAALALRLSEAALESGDWRAVAGALEAEAGPGAALRFEPEGSAADPEPATHAPSRILAVPGVGTWTLNLPSGDGGAGGRGVPLRETLALAARLGGGLPLPRPDLEAVLDPLPYAAILLDGQARLLFVNAVGEDLLASRRLFRPSRPGARLRAARRVADEALEGAIDRILREGDPGASWSMRGLAGSHLMIRLRAIGPPQPDRGPAARLVMTLRLIGAARGARRPER